MPRHSICHNSFECIYNKLLFKGKLHQLATFLFIGCKLYQKRTILVTWLNRYYFRQMLQIAQHLVSEIVTTVDIVLHFCGFLQMADSLQLVYFFLALLTFPALQILQLFPLGRHFHLELRIRAGALLRVDLLKNIFTLHFLFQFLVIDSQFSR